MLDTIKAWGLAIAAFCGWRAKVASTPEQKQENVTAENRDDKHEQINDWDHNPPLPPSS